MCCDGVKGQESSLHGIERVCKHVDQGKEGLKEAVKHHHCRGPCGGHGVHSRGGGVLPTQLGMTQVANPQQHAATKPAYKGGLQLSRARCDLDCWAHRVKDKDPPWMPPEYRLHQEGVAGGGLEGEFQAKVLGGGEDGTYVGIQGPEQ